MRHALLTVLLVWVLYHTTTSAKPAAVNPKLFSNAHFFKKKEESHVADTAIQKLYESTSKLRFGARLGLGVSNTNFNKGYPKPETRMDMAWKPSFSVGIILRVSVCNKLSVQQEYLYTHLKGEVESEGISYNLSYISLPVLFIYEAVPKLSFVLGPHFDLLVQAKEKYNVTNTDITHYIEERSIGGVIGISYRVSDAVHIDGRYQQSINQIGIRRGVLVKEFKAELLQISIYVLPFH